jgi:hypothetical protein
MAQLTAALWPHGILPDAWLWPLHIEDQRAAWEALQQALRSARRPLRPASEGEALRGRTEAAKEAALHSTAGFNAAAKARLAAGGRGAYSGAVLSLLRDAPGRLSAAQVRIALDDIPDLGPMLHKYTKSGLVERGGDARAYLYSITPLGRARLANAR